MHTTTNHQSSSIKNFIDKADASDSMVKDKHFSLLNSNRFLRDDKVKDHFCVYFAGLNLEKEKVLLGHHRKSGLWLFNGGHLDSNETISECLFREVGEEWGVDISQNAIVPHFRLSITRIDNPKQPFCSWHYDLWHFINLDTNMFQPNKKKVDTEFYEIRWVNITEALQLSNDLNTKETLDWLQNIVFSQA